MQRLFLLACVAGLSSAALASNAAGQTLPQYCKTEAGVLGPYSNPGNIRVGDPCFGTKDGRRYDGTAVMGPEAGTTSNGLPRYCRTEAGVLGPYENPGNIRVGDPCFGTKDGRRYDGTAVMGPESTRTTSDLPRYCKTTAGVLGPYDNPGNVRVGDPCFGTKDGQRYEGTAVSGPDSGTTSTDLPHYCRTEAGILGPYDNPGSVHVGDPCFGTKDGRRYDGVAVMSP